VPVARARHFWNPRQVWSESRLHNWPRFWHSAFRLLTLNSEICEQNSSPTKEFSWQSLHGGRGTIPLRTSTAGGATISSVSCQSSLALVLSAPLRCYQCKPVLFGSIRVLRNGSVASTSSRTEGTISVSCCIHQSLSRGICSPTTVVFVCHNAFLLASINAHRSRSPVLRSFFQTWISLLFFSCFMTIPCSAETLSPSNKHRAASLGPNALRTKSYANALATHSLLSRWTKIGEGSYATGIYVFVPWDHSEILEAQMIVSNSTEVTLCSKSRHPVAIRQLRHNLLYENPSRRT
jgi:hypothetical protein